MQVSSEYERDEALYREIITVLRFEENKDALKLLLDIKYEEVESTVLRERDLAEQLNFLEQKDHLRAHAKLVALSVFPAANDDFYTA
jgi:hypothetical protein